MRLKLVSGITIAVYISDALSLFPESVDKKGRGNQKAMKILRQIIFTSIAVIGLSMAVFAQKDGPKKPPPKDPDRPVVNPREKPPKNDGPRDDRPKKPSMDFVLIIDRSKDEVA